MYIANPERVRSATDRDAFNIRGWSARVAGAQERLERQANTAFADRVREANIRKCRAENALLKRDLADDERDRLSEELDKAVAALASTEADLRKHEAGEVEEELEVVEPVEPVEPIEPVEPGETETPAPPAETGLEGFAAITPPVRNPRRRS